MANHISLRGFVSSDMEMHTTDSGLVVGQFRMGSNVSRLDPVSNQWVEGKTNWFRVNAFRTLASNTMVSIHKGDRVLVVGKLRITAFVRKDGTPGTGVEIDAEGIGPDLLFGIASYQRMTSARPAGKGNGASGPQVVDGAGQDLSQDSGRLNDDHDDGGDEDIAADKEAIDELDDSEGADVNTQTGEILKEGVPF